MIVFVLPERLVPSDPAITPAEELKLRNEARGGLLQGFLGLTVAIGTYLTISVSREGQITDRFNKAIEQLGSDKVDIRLGGIYALERIARSSQADHGPIMEVLTTYIREHSPWPPARPGQFRPGVPIDQVPELRVRAADLQAVVTVICRRVIARESGPDRLDLSKVDLRRAELREAHLEETWLEAAHLEGADLFRAHLEGAGLSDAHLEGADLGESHLQRVFAWGIHLEGAKLGEAHFEGADMGGAHLRGIWALGIDFEGARLYRADLVGATLLRGSLKGADLTQADLRGVSLVETAMDGANLTRADLRGANLGGDVGFLGPVTGLTKDQVASALTDETTRLPEYLGQTDGR